MNYVRGATRFRVFLLITFVFFISIKVSLAATFVSSSKVFGDAPSENAINVVYVRLGKLSPSFTDEQMNTRFINAVNNSHQFINIQPFLSYQSYFNIHSVIINNPEATIAGRNQVRSLIQDNTNYTPDILIFMVYENLRVFCTTGGVACATSKSIDGEEKGDLYLGSQDRNTTVHELGHAFGDLADEYIDNLKCPTQVLQGQANEENLSKTNDLDEVKWKKWLIQNDGDLGSPEQGGGYCQSGVYRPSANSVMRSSQSSVNFDSVGREEMIHGINAYAKPIVSKIPETLVHSVPLNQNSVSLNFELNPYILPQGQSPIIRWYIDKSGTGVNPVLIPGAESTELVLDISDLDEGETFVVQPRIYDSDPNNWVRTNSFLSSELILGFWGIEGMSLLDRFSNSNDWYIVRVPLQTAANPHIIKITDQGATPGFTAGELALISGTNLRGSQLSITVGDITLDIATILDNGGIITESSILFTIPELAVSGNVVVTSSDGSSDPYYLSIGPPPFIGDVLTIIPGADINGGDLVAIQGTDLCGNPCDLSTTTIRIDNLEINSFIDGSNGFLVFNIPVSSRSGILRVITSAGLSNNYDITIINPPVISELFPDSSNTVYSVRDVIVITGEHLCIDKPVCNRITNTTKVSFGGVEATDLIGLEENFILLKIPEGAVSGQVIVTTPFGSSNPINISIADTPPVINNLLNPSGNSSTVLEVGDMVAITGDYLCGNPCDSVTTRVTIGNVEVTSFVGNNNGFIMFVVPNGVNKSASFIKVSTADGTSLPYNVEFANLAPEIDFLTNSTNATHVFNVNETLAIFGYDLCGTPCNSSTVIVEFPNGARASVFHNVTEKLLIVNVPQSAAGSFGLLRVITPNGQDSTNVTVN